MARTTLATVLASLRDLLGDWDGTQWDDDRLQRRLDADWRSEWRYAPLTPIATRTPQGLTSRVFTAPVGHWESPEIVDSSWAIVEPEASDTTAARWTFAQNQPTTLLVSGFTYDIFGAAADLLTAEAAQARNRPDVTDASGASIKRSQIVKTMLDVAAQYRARQGTPFWPGAERLGGHSDGVSMYRSDVAVDPMLRSGNGYFGSGW